MRDSSDSEESEDEEFEPVAEPDLPNLSLEQIEEYKRIRSREEISRRRAEKRGPDDFVLDEAERSDDDVCTLRYSVVDWAGYSYYR